jgi:hypothetical protein
LAATDQGIPEEHPVMIPLVEALKANQQVR